MKWTLVILLSAVFSHALERREESYPGGETRLMYYFRQDSGRVVKEGNEKEFYPSGRLKRITAYRNNLKHGPEKIYDEEGIELENSRYVDGRLESREGTFENETEHRLGRRVMLSFNPLPALLGLALAPDDLAIPVLPVELGYHLGGYYGLKLSPAFVLNGEGGWGARGGVSITDMANTWIGNVFDLQYGYYDIFEFGQAWNITGFYSRNYALGKDFVAFWGLLTGYGLKGVELIKSRSIESGESRIVDRNLDKGFILGLSAGMGYSF